jgi:hypothetical protein
LVDAAATDTDAGTVRLAVDELSFTAKPPAGAGPESVTVQLPEAPGFTFCGVHARLCNDGRGVTVSWNDLAVPPKVAVIVAV